MSMSMQPQMMQPILFQAPAMGGIPMVPASMQAPMQAAMPMSMPMPMQPGPMQQPGMPPALNNQVGVQRYMPLSSMKRPFSEAENAAIKKGEDQWIPSVGNNYSTPIPSLLASPTKAGLMSGALLGGLVGITTRMLASGSSNLGLKVIIATLIGGGIGAFTGFIHRKQKNGDMLDLMQRLPEGASKRDMLSDPVYQSDLNRRAQGGSSYGATDGLMTGMLAGSLMSRPYSSSHSNSRPSSYHSSSGSSKSSSK
jgi:hypothetical protein